MKDTDLVPHLREDAGGCPECQTVPLVIPAVCGGDPSEVQRTWIPAWGHDGSQVIILGSYSHWCSTQKMCRGL